MRISFFLKILSGMLMVLLTFHACNLNQNKTPVENLRSVEASIFVYKLPKVLKETSGLVHFKDRIWTINDSGGKNILYGYNPGSGKIDHQVIITNAINRDWEALCKDEEYIYIGDIGNNRGNRADLKVYKIPISMISEGKSELEAEEIRFAWADQKKFIWVPQKHPYDCEAMISLGDSLYLFIKDWMSGKTRVYGVPKIPGEYNANAIASFNVGALVTGASLSKDASYLVLSSYFQYTPSLWIFWDFKENHFFEGQSMQFYYPNYHDAQTEGVCFYGKDTILVSAERTNSHPQRIYSFSLSELIGLAQSDSIH